MICKRCDRELPEDQFQALSGPYNAGKRDSTCRSCRRAQAKVRIAAQWDAWYASRLSRNIVERDA